MFSRSYDHQLPTIFSCLVSNSSLYKGLSLPRTPKYTNICMRPKCLDFGSNVLLHFWPILALMSTFSSNIVSIFGCAEMPKAVHNQLQSLNLEI